MSASAKAWADMSQEEFDQHIAALEASFAGAHTEDAFVAVFASFAEQIFACEEKPGKVLGTLVFHMLEGVTKGYWWGKDGGQA